MKLILSILSVCLLTLMGAVITKYLAVIVAPMWLILLGVVLILTLVTRIAVWHFIGRRWQISFAYPFLSINYLLAIPIGVVLFDESLTCTRLVGATLICVGVVVLTRSRHREEPSP